MKDFFKSIFVAVVVVFATTFCLLTYDNLSDSKHYRDSMKKALAEAGQIAKDQNGQVEINSSKVDDTITVHFDIGNEKVFVMFSIYDNGHSYKTTSFPKDSKGSGKTETFK